MGNSPFKMPGMAFKEGQTPIKKISFSTLSKTLGSGKFGETGVGKVLTDVTGAIGKGQDFITKMKDKIGVERAGSVEEDIDTPNTPDVDINPETPAPPAPPPPESAPKGKYQGKGEINQPFNFSPVPKNRNPHLQQEKLFGEEPKW